MIERRGEFADERSDWRVEFKPHVHLRQHDRAFRGVWTRPLPTKSLKFSASCGALSHRAKLSLFFVQAAASGSGSDCTQTVDVASVDASLLSIDSVAHHGIYTYPDGVLHFDLPQCQAADVDVVFTTANFGPGWSWRYYGPSTPGDVSTLGWHEAPSLVVTRVGGDWKLHLANGQFGSYRPSVADSILFEGGSAYTDTVFTDTFE